VVIAEVYLDAHDSWQARKGYIASNRHRPCPGASKSTAQLAARKGYVWTQVLRRCIFRADVKRPQSPVSLFRTCLS